jgi:hypothetical protein
MFPGSRTHLGYPGSPSGRVALRPGRPPAGSPSGLIVFSRVSSSPGSRTHPGLSWVALRATCRILSKDVSSFWNRSSSVVRQSDATELARELGYLPLALEQAAAYVAEAGTPFCDYLESYRRRHLELLEQARPQTGDYQATVASTWSLSFQQIAAESPASADMLCVLAFLAPDAIPLEIFEEGSAEMGETLAEALGDDPLALAELLKPLHRFSLVERDMEARTLSVHRMVQ